nr:cysteine-rich protein 3 isoform X5 [Equus asinus]
MELASRRHSPSSLGSRAGGAEGEKEGARCCAWLPAARFLLSPTAEKVSSLGKNWHRFCLKCERCHSVLSPGGHAEHNGRPYCHKPCYGTLFGPRGVNIGGVGSYLYNSPTPTPASTTPLSPSSFSPPRPRTGLPQGKKTEKVMSLGRNWHRPCLRCQRCRKTLTAGSHAEV